MAQPAPQIVAANASDPSVDGALLAWHEPGAPGVLVRDGAAARVEGSHPALGGGRLAVLREGAIRVRPSVGDGPAADIPVAGADALAVSAAWVVWRARDARGDAIFAAPLAGGAARMVMAGRELGRPALDGNLLAFHAPTRSGVRIVLADLAAGSMATIRRERRVQLLNPSLLGGALAYVRSRYDRQELRLGQAARGRTRADRALWSTVPTGRRDAGHEPGIRHHRHGHPRRLWPRPRAGLATTVWTTALAPDAVYVTLLRQHAGRPLRAELFRIAR